MWNFAVDVCKLMLIGEIIVFGLHEMGFNIRKWNCRCFNKKDVLLMFFFVACAVIKRNVKRIKYISFHNKCDSFLEVYGQEFPSILRTEEYKRYNLCHKTLLAAHLRQTDNKLIK